MVTNKQTAPARLGRGRRGEGIRSEAAFRKRLQHYVEHCAEHKRIPNAAGFCSYCGIMRKDYLDLAKRFPLQFDIAESTFLDEALNTKAANTGAMMQFLMTLRQSFQDEGMESDLLTVLCDHDAAEDGQ